ncbi:MAG: fused MFS/spermidine synthase, partial [Geobacteraceae bacterium]|nr:fused MFS/spermidine synthase [Geobacteraceae bacterium]
IFFLSGAAALVHEIIWSRYLSLVFGGSHLAITTVLTVFMAGLALGSFLIGRVIDRKKRLLRLFAFLELGVGLSAFLFLGLMQIYPPVYVTLAQHLPESPFYLSVIRITFATFALIVPTTLMGGTLPVLTAFSSRVMKGAGTRLSFLYGCNTLGAVCGAAATGFVMLQSFSVSTTLTLAAAVNILVSLSAFALERMGTEPTIEELPAEQDKGPASQQSLWLPSKLVLLGIGVSGFCAMGYEVLWNRVLSIAIGASSYGFTLLLMAFLSGIGLGSAAFGVVSRIRLKRWGEFSSRTAVIFFGLIQIVIAAAALTSSAQFGHLPGYTAFLHDYFTKLLSGAEQFQAVQLANFILAFTVMFIPAFFMGVAFPLAGEIHCRFKRSVGSAVGEVLSINTIGAIAGAAASGFLFIYQFGIQRSLQIFILINFCYGLLLLASVFFGKNIFRLVAALSVAVLMVPLFAPGGWHLWDPKLYAIYQSNKPEIYGTDDEINEMLANMDVRYYSEGTQSIVSAVQSNDTLFFITNGRVEASNAHQDMQCQYVLGHLPMLLHKNPRNVFVLGTGSGMTLGAVSVHPSVENITLAEIEPGVLGVAKVFGIDNHYILNRPDPRLKVVFNDGRNHLLTTKDRFDVITADPVHPWFSGSGYLYSTEYFKLASQRLKPGGIICQWLPLYELTEANLKSVVKTIRENFAYTMIWVTHYDAEIIASNSPIVIDENELKKRMQVPEIAGDLRQIKMSRPEEFLSFFLMGSVGTKGYSHGGRLNTDDNLYLEMSAPKSIGMEYLRAGNLATLFKHREKLNPYLRPAKSSSERDVQNERWESNYRAALLEDRAHLLDVSGKSLTIEFNEIAARLEDLYPRYAPWRFTKDQSGDERGGTPLIMKEMELQLIDENEKLVKMNFMAVLVRKNSRFARVFFVDDTTRTVFGKLRVKGSGRNAFIEKFVADVSRDTKEIYAAESAKAAAGGKPQPSLLTVFPKIKTVVEARIDLE